ncbi:MAG: preprotein translocase subunit YajC [Candidatus Aminicenantes bacterium]|nr:preprotein translocase subunit YajC [Candidatus Aminicenantes bacterium]
MNLINLVQLMAQAQPPSQAKGPGLLTALFPFIIVLVIFWLLLILPQQRRQKKHMQMVESLKPGDRIITTGGIFGTVMGVYPDRIELKIAANVKIDITKSAVAVILERQKPEAKTES